MDFTTKKTPRPVSPSSANACSYLQINTFGRVLAVKSRLPEVALTFAVVKQHFCWLTVPPCYSCSANQYWVFIWLVLLSSPTPNHITGLRRYQLKLPPGFVSNPTGDLPAKTTRHDLLIDSTTWIGRYLIWQPLTGATVSPFVTTVLKRVSLFYKRAQTMTQLRFWSQNKILGILHTLH